LLQTHDKASRTGEHRYVHGSKFLDPIRHNPLSNRPNPTQTTNIWEKHNRTQSKGSSAAQQ